MHLSSKGLALVKSFEGCLTPVASGMFAPYICPAGVLTIGWGHTNDGGRPFDKSARWSQAECDKALADDMVRYERAVERLVKVQLTQGQFDALTSFCYNCGETNLGKSTLLRCVNAGDFEGAARQFAAWNKGGGKVLAGLTRRRAAEAALFRSDSIIPPVRPTADTEPMAQRVDAPDDHVNAPDDHVNAPEPSPAENAPTTGGFFGRARNWIVAAASSVGFGGLGALTDWQIAAVLFGFVFLSVVCITAFIIIFFGAEPVRQWVQRHVA